MAARFYRRPEPGPGTKETIKLGFDAEYEPSPWEPIAQEVERYERTDGAEPSEIVGEHWVILWTVGAKSGKVRKTPLVRVTDGNGRYSVIGSQGGAPTHPQWVHNLRANPIARLQDGGVVGDYTVREVDGEDKAAWWARSSEVWPDYDGYQEATDRPIPLFVLEPTG
jgi:deazaflavin-dependent oxidoreductase (nitroreductase family)